jgi:hypothetical protein
MKRYTARKPKSALSGSERVALIAALLTFFGVVGNGILGYANWSSNKDISAQQIRLHETQIEANRSIENLKLDVSLKEQELDRFVVVRDLLPLALAANGRDRAVYVTLMQFMLPEKQFRLLASTLQTSADDQIRSIGNDAALVLDQRDEERIRTIKDLVSKIESEERSVRLAAMDSLYASYMTDHALTSELIEYLQRGLLQKMDVNGRINAFFLIISTADSAWSPGKAEAALVLMNDLLIASKDPTRGPAFGTQATEAYHRAVQRIRMASLSSD